MKQTGHRSVTVVRRYIHVAGGLRNRHTLRHLNVAVVYIRAAVGLSRRLDAVQVDARRVSALRGNGGDRSWDNLSRTE